MDLLPSTVAFDIDPVNAIASKRTLCTRAAADELLVFAHHIPPFPSLGRIVAHGEGWQWHPVIIE